MLDVKIKLTNGAVMPKYETKDSSGFDIAAVEMVKAIKPGETVLIPTGLFMQIPIGYELQIRPRSGVTLKTDLRIANSPGTIDADFRGEIKVMVTNTSKDIFGSILIQKGERIAQGVFAQVPKAIFTEVSDLENSDRGAGGFGSTGKTITNNQS